MRRFKSFFGVTPEVCECIRNLIEMELNDDSQPKHLLWCLNFLKQYTVEHTRRTLFAADEKAIRKWTWIYVQHIADLNVVHLKIIVKIIF